MAENAPPPQQQQQEHQPTLTFGDAISHFITTNDVHKMRNLYDASKILARCVRLHTLKVASIDIKTKATTRRALISVNDNDVLASIRCVGSHIQCTIRVRGRLVFGMVQRGNEALGREVFFDVLQFFTQNVQYEKAWIRAEWEPFTPVLLHLGKLTLIARETTFVGEHSQSFQEPLYRRWIQFFNIKFEKLVMACLKINKVFYPKMNRRVMVAPHHRIHCGRRRVAFGEATSGDAGA